MRYAKPILLYTLWLRIRNYQENVCLSQNVILKTLFLRQYAPFPLKHATLERAFSLSKPIYTPGNGSKAGIPAGQFPIFAGSFPIRMNCPTAGVGPSSTKSMNHPGGATCAFGGAVSVQVLPAQETSGKIVR